MVSIGVSLEPGLATRAWCRLTTDEAHTCSNGQDLNNDEHGQRGLESGRSRTVTYHGEEDQPVLRAQDVEDQAARVKAHGNSDARQDRHDDPGRDDGDLIVRGVPWGALRGCRIEIHGGTVLCSGLRIQAPPLWFSRVKVPTIQVGPPSLCTTSLSEYLFHILLELWSPRWQPHGNLVPNLEHPDLLGRSACR